jgi:hypothetical protein
VLGTCTLLFAHAKNFFSHGLTALMLCLSLLALFRAVRSNAWYWAALSGACAGAMVLTRLDSAVSVPLLGAYLLLAGVGSKDWDWRRRAWQLLIFGLPLIVAAALVVAYNELRFGVASRPGYNFGAFGWSFLPRGLSGHLFSPARSIFVYSPPLLLTLPFLGKFLKRHPAEAMLSWGLLAASLVLYSAWWFWSGGWCYGNRFLLPMVPVLLMALPLVLEDLSERKKAWKLTTVALILLVGLCVQVLGIVPYLTIIFTRESLNSQFPHYLWSLSDGQLAHHLRYTLEGHTIDLWLVRLAGRVSLPWVLAAALPPLMCLVGGGGLLWNGLRLARDTDRQVAEPSDQSVEAPDQAEWPR